MSLNATNFVVKGPIKSADLKQFVDLFTGVMIDQPVTFKNATTIGGSQGSSTAPLKLFGVAGQTGNLIELYPTSGSANPTFGFGALGNFAWGPGSPAANDTFLSRIAMQNGHVADTAGLLVTPYLEVAGNISATGYTFTNQATITGPGANPFLLVINQDLTVNRDATVTRNLLIGAASPTLVIHSVGTPATRLAIESPGDAVGVAGKTNAQAGANIYFDGTNWVRYDTAQGGMLLSVNVADVVFYSAGAGANPITPLQTLMTVTRSTGVVAVIGPMTVGGMVDAAAFRATLNAVPPSGAGLELVFAAPNAYVTSYDRSAGAFKDLILQAHSISLNTNAGGVLSLPASSVTTPMIAANAVQQLLGSYSGTPTYSTATINTWLNTPVVVNFTSGGGMIRIELTAVFVHTVANAQMYFGISIDTPGTPSVYWYTTLGGAANCPIALTGVFYHPSLPAGPHTAYLVIFLATPGTLSHYGAGYHTMYVTEQKR